MVARDYGFAPNPFYGICTLATCKPLIRKAAMVDDWVIGTGSRSYGLNGYLVFAMKIAETVTFDEYWADVRFCRKRPYLRGSLKQAFGDNIYHHNRVTGKWLQENSHHSLPDGNANTLNLRHDTQIDRVLIANEFTYWGSDAVRIPRRFRSYKGYDVCVKYQGHKSKFPLELVQSFVRWIESLGAKGYVGQPSEFPN